MYKIVVSLFATLILANTLIYGAAKPKITVASGMDYSKKVVATVGKDEITFGDLEKAFQKNLYRKNIQLSKISKDSLMDFLTLYVNFRLKVNDALARGYDKDSSVKSDLEQNRKLLAESFYYDKILTEPNVNIMLKRREKEYKIALILTTYNHATQDTSTAFTQIKAAMNSLKDGVPFDSVAKMYSNDPTSSKNGGVIAVYLTSGKVHKPIEDAIYATKKGEVNPNIIPTRFGFFIIKVLDEIQRVKVKGSHILIAINENRDSAQAFQLADSLLNVIKKGGNFIKLAERFSDDATTAKNGGSLGSYYSRSTGLDGNNNQPLVAEFDNQLMDLKDGEISNLVRTDYGFHIIRRDSSKGMDYDTEKLELKNYYKKNLFSDEKRAYLDRIKTKYNFILNENTLKEVLSYIDTNITNLQSNWTDKIPKDIRNKELFRLNDKVTNFNDYIELFNSKNELRGIGVNREGVTKGVELLIEPIIFAEETKDLETKYPEFAVQMKEFRDGILLFKLETMEVWDKLKLDSVNARKFYDSTKSKYRTDYQYRIVEVFSLTDSASKITLEKAVKGADFESLAENETQRSGYREKKGNWGLLEPNQNKLAKYAFDNNAKAGDVLGPIVNDNGFSVLKIMEILPPHEKTFEEALKELSPKWQELTQKSLTNTWLNKAKKSFPVKIDNKEIDAIIKAAKD